MNTKTYSRLSDRGTGLGICEPLISEARRLLLDMLQSFFVNDTLSLEGCYLKILFRDGSRLFVTYNSHQEYSYQYIYSMSKNDRERFDNYDRHWPVKSKPHHFHIRGHQDVKESPMTGDPSNDIPILVEFLKNHLKI